MENGLLFKAKLHYPGFTFSIDHFFEPGITAVFGHSGAGKSTMMHCIGGGVAPEEGEIIVNGRVLFSSQNKINVAIHKRKIGYVFQDGRLFPHYTVKKNLLYGTRFVKRALNNLNFEKVVEMLEISHLLNKVPSDISGGERQRVALGRALLASPEVLLLDEPFSALDQKLRLQIIPFISKIAEEWNIPVVIVSHDLPDVLKLTERLCIVKKGNIISKGLYSEMIKDPAVLKELPIEQILNTVNLKVKEVNVESGIVKLNGLGEKNINILFEPSKKQYNVGETIRVFIRPDDIVLSVSELSGVSFRNSIVGTIVDIIEEGVKVMCYVDCGFLLIAEVSKASQSELKLNKGMKIYCLFKTLSLDSIKI